MDADERMTAAEFDSAWMEHLERDGFWMSVAAFDNRGETVDRYTVLIEVEPPWGLGEDEMHEAFTLYCELSYRFGDSPGWVPRFVVHES